MTLVSEKLIYRNVQGYEKLEAMLELLEKDEEIQRHLRMANVMAVSRLGYNDHGVVHSRIVAGSALEIFKLIVESGVTPSVVKDHIGNLEDSMLVVMAGGYLHDIGNSIHRVMHNLHGCIILSRILPRLLESVYREEPAKIHTVKSEILHVVFSHDEAVPTLSIEAGIVKVADGTDMAEGRARIPYKIGKIDIHSLSALAIKRVLITHGTERPVRIIVEMENEAGYFQVEKVLGEKIKGSSIANMVEVAAFKQGEELKTLRI